MELLTRQCFPGPGVGGRERVKRKSPLFRFCFAFASLLLQVLPVWSWKFPRLRLWRWCRLPRKSLPSWPRPRRNRNRAEPSEAESHKATVITLHTLLGKGSRESDVLGALYCRSFYLASSSRCDVFIAKRTPLASKMSTRRIHAPHAPAPTYDMRTVLA